MLQQTKFGRREERKPEEIGERARRISETRKLEHDDIILFAVRSLKSDVEKLNSRADNTDERIGRLRDRIDSNFKWMVGITIAMWVSIILTIVFV